MDDPLATGDQPNPFEALRNHPQFAVLREAIQRNPQVITELLQQYSQSNPQLVRQITENPQEFLRLFQDQQGAPQPNQVAIQVTPEERAAIERLIQLTGMDKHEVIEAYFACDKNEELTASYLFERADEDD
ncbi:repC-binding protein A [Cavenderia fasciculata]|uniref:UV excision repair protein RAD23 n=1 Tax=Cavenderia fasciculata TaxID=261658 RepID=F4QDT5_CACFS|nr:repC-binding protein A [Cavenderia fasciculata]EGG13882.1 repC-binding protein A [Cavenderia fasciculata]|eukprot:XP_004350590.1 repC-binding protein A [Cavenderia fasciculata]